MSGWIFSNYMSWGTGRMRQAPSVEKLVIGAHSCSRIPSGPPVITVPQPAWVLCACLSQECVYFRLYARIRAAPSLVLYAGTSSELNVGQSEESGKKTVWAHLVVIGRRKKGPCVLGTGSKRLTQPNPARYSSEPANMGGKNLVPTAGLLPFSPPYAWPILIIPQQSPRQHFFYKHCSELSHSFHFNIRE